MGVNKNQNSNDVIRTDNTSVSRSPIYERIPIQTPADKAVKARAQRRQMGNAAYEETKRKEKAAQQQAAQRVPVADDIQEISRGAAHAVFDGIGTVIGIGANLIDQGVSNVIGTNVTPAQSSLNFVGQTMDPGRYISWALSDNHAHPWSDDNHGYEDVMSPSAAEAANLTTALALTLLGAKGVGKVTGKAKPTLVRRPHLSESERLGIPKGERNQPKVYNDLGNAKYPNSRLEELTVENPRFGDMLGSGSEQTVFSDLNNPQRVLKVYSDRRFSSLDELRDFHRTWFIRNQVPFQKKMKFEGYVQDNRRIFPVYSQERVNPIGLMQFERWNKEYLPKINEMLESKGFENNFNGKIHLNDINPTNIGYDRNGNLSFFDVEAY